jgi:hypothetical protein
MLWQTVRVWWHIGSIVRVIDSWIWHIRVSILWWCVVRALRNEIGTLSSWRVS